MKKWYMSKTIWFNIFSGIFAVLATMEAQIREAISTLGINGGVVIIFIAVMNVFLRIITTKGIE